MIEHLQAHTLRIACSALKIAAATHLAWNYGYCQSAAGGPSMLPTFAVQGDHLFMDMSYRRGRGIAVGDIVCFKTPMFSKLESVKRVVGLPGDYVVLGTPGEPGDEHMIQVPEGHCWVVGDNLAASRDSRHFGPLPMALIKGRVTARLLPLNDMRWFHNELEAANDAA
jgi:inner membrane protease subunit 1